MCTQTRYGHVYVIRTRYILIRYCMWSIYGIIYRTLLFFYTLLLAFLFVFNFFFLRSVSEKRIWKLHRKPLFFLFFFIYRTFRDLRPTCTRSRFTRTVVPTHGIVSTIIIYSGPYRPKIIIIIRRPPPPQPYIIILSRVWFMATRISFFPSLNRSINIACRSLCTRRGGTPMTRRAFIRRMKIRPVRESLFDRNADLSREPACNDEARGRFRFNTFARCAFFCVF